MYSPFFLWYWNKWFHNRFTCLPQPGTGQNFIFGWSVVGGRVSSGPSTSSKSLCSDSSAMSPVVVVIVVLRWWLLFLSNCSLYKSLLLLYYSHSTGLSVDLPYWAGVSFCDVTTSLSWYRSSYVKVFMMSQQLCHGTGILCYTFVMSQLLSHGTGILFYVFVMS